MHDMALNTCTIVYNVISDILSLFDLRVYIFIYRETGHSWIAQTIKNTVKPDIVGMVV